MAPLTSYSGVTFSVETPRVEEYGHFLDGCFLCGRPLRGSSEVFMYRGDTPFCSEDCRQEQIEQDEARERETKYRQRRHHRRYASSVELPVSSALAVKAVAAT